ncbi:MAG: hypothetical protein H6612_10405 [Ignavibacteriales bacterium]|nr:hypothetical protein [Ignavibacteriales bacterium]
MKKFFLFFLVLILAVVIFFYCSSETINQINKENAHYKILNESEILPIKLLGEIAERNSEISGLCWFGSKLILLPQYPNNFKGSAGKIFYIEKNRLDNYINGNDTSPILPEYFEIDLSAIKDFFQLGSGFEAITIIDNTAYFTIESLNNGKTETLLVKGIIDTLNNSIGLDENSIVKDPADLFIHNISDESILNYQNNIFPIYEIFGKNINKKPQVSVFDNNLKFLQKIDFPNIEYRITDVTSVDDSDKFWAINYFYPGDNKKLNPAKDELFEKYGIGKSHQYLNPVERLVEFKILDKKIDFSEKSPIYLKLLPNDSRNWEGIARFENKGFLLTTDTFPETILAFVKTN